MGTVGFAEGGANDLAWHATVGDDEVAIHLEADEWGYHAREFSRDWIGIEFAQATIDRPICDAQIRAALWYLRRCVLPVYPELDLSHFMFHSECAAGVRDGKTDPFANHSSELADLRRRILETL